MKHSKTKQPSARGSSTTTMTMSHTLGTHARNSQLLSPVMIRNNVAYTQLNQQALFGYFQFLSANSAFQHLSFPKPTFT